MSAHQTGSCGDLQTKVVSSDPRSYRVAQVLALPRQISMVFTASLLLLAGAAHAAALEGVVRVPLHRREQTKPLAVTTPVSTTLRSSQPKIALRNYMDAQVRARCCRAALAVRGNVPSLSGRFSGLVSCQPNAHVRPLLLSLHERSYQALGSLPRLLHQCPATAELQVRWLAPFATCSSICKLVWCIAIVQQSHVVPVLINVLTMFPDIYIYWTAAPRMYSL